MTNMDVTESGGRQVSAMRSFGSHAQDVEPDLAPDVERSRCLDIRQPAEQGVSRSWP